MNEFFKTNHALSKKKKIWCTCSFCINTLYIYISFVHIMHNGFATLLKVYSSRSLLIWMWDCVAQLLYMSFVDLVLISRNYSNKEGVILLKVFLWMQFHWRCMEFSFSEVLMINLWKHNPSFIWMEFKL